MTVAARAGLIAAPRATSNGSTIATMPARSHPYIRSVEQQHLAHPAAFAGDRFEGRGTGRC